MTQGSRALDATHHDIAARTLIFAATDESNLIYTATTLPQLLPFIDTQGVEQAEVSNSILNTIEHSDTEDIFWNQNGAP